MNSLNELLLFIFIGRIFIYLWMQFPIPERLEMVGAIRKLHECSLCSGTWVYSILFLVFQIDLLHLLELPYVRFMGEIITGGVVSFLVHVFEIGWTEKFNSLVILE